MRKDGSNQNIIDINSIGKKYVNLNPSRDYNMVSNNNVNKYLVKDKYGNVANK